jgi:hypothetical protein
MARKLAQIAVCLLPLALCVIMMSCGRKAPPVPPGTIRPKTINDLRYQITPKGVTLTWGVPVRNTDGSPLARIEGFDLFKAEVESEGTCTECPPPFGRPIEIPFGAKPEEARQMIYEDRTLVSGRRYIYEVRTVKGWFNVGDPSNRISLAWHPPPAAPKDLVARSMEDGVLLSWLSPTTWSDGSPLDRPLAYRLYRTGLAEGGWKPLLTLVEGTQYLDRTARPRRRYRYCVAAVLSYLANTEIEGPKTPPVAALHHDLAPPQAPEGLVAVPTSRGVELLWKESADPDLHGYLVYREGVDDLIERVTVEPIKGPRFLDQKILRPGRYKYWITAVDRADPPNESAPSGVAEVEVSKPGPNVR